MMNHKIKKNDPCPCGSGRKYKHCHLDQNIETINDTTLKDSFIPGIKIDDYTDEEKLSFLIGAPGATVSNSYLAQGDMDLVRKDISKYKFVLNFDIPVLLPLDDEGRYIINFENDDYVFFHKIKKRGEENYSTLDTKVIPYFSSIQIQGRAFVDFNPKDGMPELPLKSNRLINYILGKIIEFLDGQMNIDLDKSPILSYHIIYFEINDHYFSNGIAKVTFPYNKEILIKSPDTIEKVEHKELQIFLIQKFKLNEFSATKILPHLTGKSFEEKVFLSAHDFCYYSKQHPEALSKLHEEELRDLYLVVLKNIFTNAEGEAFNYDGKLDFKIINKDNKYEFISGEFKKWRGDDSFIDAFKQIARKHNSGQEKALYILMINENKDIKHVRTRISDLIRLEPEFLSGPNDIDLPKGSFEIFDKYKVTIKGRNIDLIIGLINLYFEKVK